MLCFAWGSVLRPGDFRPGANPRAHHPALYPWPSGPGTSLVLQRGSAATTYWQQPPKPHPFPDTGASLPLPGELFLFLPLQALPLGPSSSRTTLTWIFGSTVKIWGCSRERRCWHSFFLVTPTTTSLKKKILYHFWAKDPFSSLIKSVYPLHRTML